MQLKYSYYIATNVCCRKSATTFGDLPDCKYFQHNFSRNSIIQGNAVEIVVSEMAAILPACQYYEI